MQLTQLRSLQDQLNELGLTTGQSEDSAPELLAAYRRFYRLPDVSRPDTLPYASAGPGSDAGADEHAEEDALFASQQVSPYEYRAGYVWSDELKIFTQLWRVPGACGSVFVVPGYLDHSGLYGGLIRFFLARSFNVLTFDLPGHGLSSGRQADIDFFGRYSRVLRACMEQVRDHLPYPWHLCGQSTGASAIIDALVSGRMHETYRIGKVLLLAPLIRLQNRHSIRYRSLFLSLCKKNVRRHFVRCCSNEDFLRFQRADPLQSEVISLRWLRALYRWEHFLRRGSAAPVPLPLTMVQGGDDRTVDGAYTTQLLGRYFREVNLLLLREAGHQLANESAVFRNRYQTFLAGRLTL